MTQTLEFINFRVIGQPVPKARARVVTTGNGHARAFTPATTAAWEVAVACAYRQAYPMREPWAPGVPLRLTVEVIAPGRGPRARIRGDWDNHGKAVSDALNGVAWADDAQVVDARVFKHRAAADEEPGVVVTIQEVR